MKIRFFCAAALVLASCASENHDVRLETTLDTWRFAYSSEETSEMSGACAAKFDDSKWQVVSVPHDWAISGAFDKEIDKQIVAIEQNGEKEATEHTGRTGSLPYIGVGWYRTEFVSCKSYQRVLLSFDGVMSEPEVYVNGVYAGGWKNGYAPFVLDISDKVKFGRKNVVAVKASNVGESSRWYPGAGIYRPVKLIQTSSTAIAEWGVSVSDADLMLDDTEAQVYVSAELVGDTAGVSVDFKVYDGSSAADCYVYKREMLNAKITMKNPRLWSPEVPHLYTLVTTLTKEGNVVDRKVTKFGVRNVSYTAEKGFQLNGHSRKFKGVCLHHDLGAIGTAVNRAAIVRQINILKEMGCDAIRTAHNIPSTLQMEVCDSMGMMVMAESFDEWIYPKCQNGYHRFFEKWAAEDLKALVNCHKNHPSIVMWSIGNEIPEQWDKENGVKYVREFTDLIHSIDPDRGRIVTSGCDRIDDAVSSGFAQELDVVGMNYRTHKYQMAYEKTPQKIILGSETASTVSSRGVYKLPVVRADNKMYEDGQCSSYDMEACWWSNIPESDFELQDDKPWVIGEFVWTGFDYLGEPTPYDGFWPSRSSYFGICDLAGLPKDRYYLYRSRWNLSDETLHVLPHWTWPGHEGETIPVYCYTSFDEAELFVNGVSQGRKKKNAANLSERYRLMWNDVVYQPGELKVVAYGYDGEEYVETVRTAGAEHHLELTVDRNAINADGNDLAFITVRMVDDEGTLCPWAADQLSFEVRGAGEFKGVCNGDATSLESFVAPTMKLFNGQLVAVVQSTKEKGMMRLVVHCPSLVDAEIEILAE
ncbi:MAG: DUF4982 domain-containing protein [Bacteroidales bacterium]|nr:DUF4982 domain-containing protein [Bacteroidales bacterium]